MIEPRELFLTEEQIREFQARKSSRRSAKKPKRGIQFYKFPAVLMDALIQVDYAPAWRLAAAIYKAWFTGFKRNPVKLTSAALVGFRISKDQKWRALKGLEQTGQFAGERSERRNPLVTLRWEPIKK